MQQSSIDKATGDLREKFAGNKSILDINYDLGSGNNDIFVFVKNNNVKIPDRWRGYSVVKYNIAAARKQCKAILKRFEDEGIDATDPENSYFYELMVAGNDICDKLS